MTDYIALRDAFNSPSVDVINMQMLLNKIKFAALSKSTQSSEDENTWIETLEMAAFIYLRVNDFVNFVSYAQQLKQYYYGPDPHPRKITDRSAAIVGLYLLYLLVCDRIGDFHVDLELIPKHILTHPFVEYPITLEKAMMEGNYAKVYKAAHDPVPLPEFKIFLAPLASAVQTKASNSLLAGNTQKPISPQSTEEEALDAIGKLLGYAADLERIV